MRVELENGQPVVALTEPSPTEEQDTTRWAVVFTDVETESGALRRKAFVWLFDTMTEALDEGISLVFEHVSDQSRADWDGLDAEATRKMLMENGTYCEGEWVVAVVEVDQ